MTVAAARKWLIVSSLSVTGVVLFFFLLAPAIRFPLTFDQSLRVLEIILPVFLGYLGSAASFVFRSNMDSEVVRFRKGAAPLVSLLIIGPLAVFAISLFATIVAFGVTNRSDATPGSGMTVNQLAIGISVILGLLAVTTNVAVGYLFGGSDYAKNHDPDSRPVDSRATEM